MESIGDILRRMTVGEKGRESFAVLRNPRPRSQAPIPFGTVLEDEYWPEAKMMALGLPPGERQPDAIWISGPNVGAFADTRVGKPVEDAV